MSLINKITIIVPYYFDDIPKVVQNLVYMCNIEHRNQLKEVLNQLVYYIHCVNCNKLMDPSLINKVNCCSSVCMYELQEDPYYSDYSD